MRRVMVTLVLLGILGTMAVGPHGVRPVRSGASQLPSTGSAAGGDAQLYDRGVGPAGLPHAVDVSRGRAGSPGVSNPDLLRGLTAAQRQALARRGFVVTAPAQSAADRTHPVYQQFYDLYETNYEQGIPSFVTSDAVLHTFHVMYDQTLVALERTVLADKLARLTAGLMDVATYQYGATGDPRIKEAARLNLGYLAVAARLLNPGAPLPALVVPQVAAELALIKAHQGFAPSPLFGYSMDYSQFVPRGHYTASEGLRRYFQAMTWYGRVAFRLNGRDRLLRTRQALLLVRGVTLVPTLGALWAAIFDPITAWVGQSDDLTVRNYAAVMARVYPANAPVGVLSDDARLARFIALANALPGPQISSDLVPWHQNAARITRGLRLFGQRFVLDAAIMQALIYPRVGTRQNPRLWTTGLDVAASLGSRQATALLTGPLHQDRYAHYATNLAALQAHEAALPAATWHQNLYWRWLDTLRAVWGPVPGGAPAFMKTAAWAEKSLGTGLGSWAELRHDTLLYAKQTYGGLGAGGQPPPFRVPYVEPVPLVYARLLALTRHLKGVLAQEGVLDSLPQPVTTLMGQYLLPPPPPSEQGYRAALDSFGRLLAILQRVADRELHGHTASPADAQTLVRIGGELDLLTNFFQDNGAGHPLTPDDKRVAAIADVFTEPNSQQVLEVGVGDVLPIYAIVPIDGRSWLARGGVFSYYEFRQPMSDRLSDQVWHHLPRRPAQPAWTAGYITS
ncbi:MAG TPA: DUF3160 domain-containing protein [Chloroflexota bacterium]|nr:DUF3160 domain-containing protein [Chloroflexota bacterium]